MTTLKRSVMLAAVLALFMTSVPSSATAVGPTAGSASDPGCIRPKMYAAGPVGTGGCPGIRPGAFVIIPSQQAGCTLGFVYLDPKASRWYITTAGHCVMADGKQATWAEGKGPVVTDGDGKPFGRFVFAALKGRYDIGLILISKGITPKASMCHFGGPTGLSTSRSNGPTVLEHYGNSVFGDAGLPARTGIALGMPDQYEVGSILPSFQGDSGGPVVDGTNGKAIGYVTHLTVPLGVMGPVFVTRLGPQMSYALSFVKKSMQLRTAPHTPSSLAALSSL